MTASNFIHSVKVGIIFMTEMVDACKKIKKSVQLPVYQVTLQNSQCHFDY